MNKFLYVFNDELAKQLDFIGYKMYSETKKEDETGYKLYTTGKELDIDALSNFEVGTDYVFTNKIFFKEGTNE